ncbi:MAG: hypothetical protein JJU31_07815 [Wenzhouxiangella sp.]|nr:hypothetical protein [Wenzhouxiangella sp.]MCH8478211.1 hypothetical protein [Wenzhouxiangella sp.]
MHKILDVSDRRVRRLQLAAIFTSMALVTIAGFLLTFAVAPLWMTVLAMLIGMTGLFVAGGIRQRWELDYKGHQIRFENSPITGERLYLDGGLVSRGGVGNKMELRAPIRVGDGAGEELMALVDASLLQIQLRLYVEGAVPGDSPASPVGTAPATLPSIDAVAAESSLTHQGALGRLVLARRAVEFIGSVITIVSTSSAALLWLFRA